MLKIKKLSTWYETSKLIIIDSSFNLEEKCVVGLLGVNGAGKSTLINVLSGVHPQYTVEECLFEEKSVAFEDESLKTNSYTVFTEHEGFRYWTFRRYIAFIEKVYGIKRDHRALETLVAGFHFNDYVDRKMSELSTGNKKKAYLITGFYLKRKLLILDEPFDGLDFAATEYLYEKINEYRLYGTILMSSHIAESFDKTCDSLLLLENGKLSQKTFNKNQSLRDQIKKEEGVCSDYF